MHCLRSYKQFCDFGPNYVLVCKMYKWAKKNWTVFFFYFFCHKLSKMYNMLLIKNFHGTFFLTMRPTLLKEKKEGDDLNWYSCLLSAPRKTEASTIFFIDFV